MKQQKQKLLELRDALLDQIHDTAQNSVREAHIESSGLGMHQGDAGSDTYDRDFALTVLSQEQDALYEIEEAIKRVEDKTYGVCQMSGKQIPQARLEPYPLPVLQLNAKHSWKRKTAAAINGRAKPICRNDGARRRRR